MRDAQDRARHPTTLSRVHDFDLGPKPLPRRSAWRRRRDHFVDTEPATVLEERGTRRSILGKTTPRRPVADNRRGVNTMPNEMNAEVEKVKMKHPLVAIPIPWDTASGCVEWPLVDWTVEGDGHPQYPVLIDGGGETGAWSSDYAVQRPDGSWRFPDGELSDDENLRAAFARREAKH
jgi:hypothetical protein